MKDIEWINNLKIRASYGQTGNDQGIGYYPYQTLYELGKNNGTEAGMYFTSISNPDIMWETQVSTDAAIEFGLWDNKLSGSVEYFRKERISICSGPERLTVAKVLRKEMGCGAKQLGRVLRLSSTDLQQLV